MTNQMLLKFSISDFIGYTNNYKTIFFSQEFIAVMKNKLKRGLEKPKDTGIVNLFSAIAKCAQQTPAASVVHAPGGHGIQPSHPLPS